MPAGCIIVYQRPDPRPPRVTLVLTPAGILLLRMRFSHRFATLVASLSMVASVLVTSGFACEFRGADDMAGMTMANASIAQSSGFATVSLRAREQTPSSPAPCGLPSAPSGCQSLALCAPAAMASQRVAGPDVAIESIQVASGIVLRPPSVTTLPELPPPRA
jgi:hypothetical protein